MESTRLLNELAKAAHENAVEKGWWKKDQPFPEILALIHSEVSEALEEYRDGHKPNEIYYRHFGLHSTSQYPMTGYLAENEERQPYKPEGVPIELADIIIRILSYAGYKNIDIAAAVHVKMEYNKTRPHMHGGKLI